MKSLALFATALTLLAAPAFASGDAANSTLPASAPPVASPAPESAPVAVACKPMKFTRPDATQNTKFLVGVYGGDVQAIKACNPSTEVVQRTPNSVGVPVVYEHGEAVINLPSSMKGGTLSTFRCINDDTGGSVANVTVYRADWSDDLPDHVDMHVLDSALYNHDALLAKCQKLSAENKRY